MKLIERKEVIRLNYNENLGILTMILMTLIIMTVILVQLVPMVRMPKLMLKTMVTVLIQ